MVPVGMSSFGATWNAVFAFYVIVSKHKVVSTSTLVLLKKETFRCFLTIKTITRYKYRQSPGQESLIDGQRELTNGLPINFMLKTDLETILVLNVGLAVRV